MGEDIVDRQQYPLWQGALRSWCPSPCQICGLGEAAVLPVRGALPCVFARPHLLPLLMYDHACCTVLSARARAGQECAVSPRVCG
jgi:hypothetical protein